jgi:hypothetical protein
VVAHTDNFANALRAIKERVIFAKDVANDNALIPTPQPTILGLRRLRRARKRLTDLMTRKLTKLSPAAFAATYKGRRLVRYLQAVESLEIEPICRRDSEITAFVKYEKLVVKTLAGDLVPRLIQPRDYRYNVALGVYIKLAEHHIFRMIDRLFGGPTIMKGYNTRDMGRIMNENWERVAIGRGHVRAFGMDAARFDQHCSSSALEVEHAVYLHLFDNDPELARLLSWQRSTKGRWGGDDGFIKYKKDGGRCSGDMNTGLGNCVLMCLMVYSYLTIEHHLKPGRDYSFVNNGDDAVVFLAEGCEGIMEGLFAYFLDFGFQMEIEEPVVELEEVEFCQCKPVLTENGWVMVRIPELAMSKDQICLKGVATEGDWSYHRSMLSMAGLKMYGNIPVYSAFYKKLGEGALEKHKKLDFENVGRGVRIMSRGMDVKSTVTDATRFSYYKAFGVNPLEQIQLEKDILERGVLWSERVEISGEREWYDVGQK